VRPISAATAADRRPLWLKRQRLRQATFVAGALLLLYAVLVVIALLGGPRIGASFLPLPGGGPDPANPVAGLEPSTRLPTGGPTVPRGSETPVPTAPPTPGQTTTLPPATTTTAPITGQPTDGQTTPCPTTTPVPQPVDHQEPTIPPATKVPLKPTATVPDPTTQPTKPPATTNPPPPTTTTNPPPAPDDPEDPDPPTLVGIIGGILDVIGL